MQNGVPEHQGRGRDDTRDRVLERVASRGLIGGPQGAGNENAGDPQGAENENAMTPFGHAKEEKNENEKLSSTKMRLSPQPVGMTLLEEREVRS